MLEFINRTINNLKKKNQRENRHGNFKNYEQELFQLKKIDKIEKLVLEASVNQSLPDHIKSKKAQNSNRISINQMPRIQQLLSEDPQQARFNRNELFYKSVEERWTIVNSITKRVQEILGSKIEDNILDLNDLNQETEEMEAERLGKMMKTLDIVAMTTTGASKYRSKLRKVGAQIVMIEEAAEVLEAQIITSLTEHTKQLILIGDHLQLKPKVNSFVLSEEYGLSMSLFERLVRMGIPNIRLNEQRRMRPEISEIIRLIYPDLKDHASVKEFEDIR